MIELEPFHVMLKRKRKQLGLTKEHLAGFFGVGSLTISNWERGSKPQMGREYIIEQLRSMRSSRLPAEGSVIELELGIPPSVNNYWRYGRGHFYIQKAGKKYRQDVALIVRHAGIKPLEGDLVMEIDFYPPDRRIRDIDNLLKAILDSLEKASVYESDNQIVKLTIERLSPVKGGKIVVRLWERETNHETQPSNPKA